MTPQTETRPGRYAYAALAVTSDDPRPSPIPRKNIPLLHDVLIVPQRDLGMSNHADAGGIVISEVEGDQRFRGLIVNEQWILAPEVNKGLHGERLKIDNALAGVCWKYSSAWSTLDGITIWGSWARAWKARYPGTTTYWENSPCPPSSLVMRRSYSRGGDRARSYLCSPRPTLGRRYRPSPEGLGLSRLTTSVANQLKVNNIAWIPVVFDRESAVLIICFKLVAGRYSHAGNRKVAGVGPVEGNRVVVGCRLILGPEPFEIPSPESQ